MLERGACYRRTYMFIQHILCVRTNRTTEGTARRQSAERLVHGDIHSHAFDKEEEEWTNMEVICTKQTSKSMKSAMAGGGRTACQVTRSESMRFIEASYVTPNLDICSCASSFIRTPMDGASAYRLCAQSRLERCGRRRSPPNMHVRPPRTRRSRDAQRAHRGAVGG